MLTVIVASSAGCSSPRAAGTLAPIIDMHMHATVMSDRDKSGRPLARPCDPRPCVEQPAMFADGDVLNATLAAMDRHHIVLGFLSDDYPNVDHWVAKAPGRFLPSAAIPIDPKAFVPIPDLRRWYQSRRFKAMGEIVTQYYGIAPNDGRLEPYFALAEELDLPVLIHTAGLGGHVDSFRVDAGRPLLLEPVIAKHPKLRLDFENAGYPYLDEAIALLTQHPQVYADISTINWIIPRPALYRYLQALVDAGLGSRLMFGSDQMSWPEAIDIAVDAVQSAPFLNDSQKRDILYNNAARFLRLETAPH